MNTSPAFHSTLGVLQQVKTLVEGLRLADNTTPLFQLVRLYDANDIDRAFVDTLASRQQRLCFVLPGRITYDRTIDGRTLLLKKRMEFACLICDTDRKSGQEAVFGGDHNQGTLALSDRLVEGLSGAHLGLHGICIEPSDGDDLSVVKDGESDSGRKGWFQVFSTLAGKKGLSVYS